MADDDELFIITQTVEDNPPNIVDPTLQLPDHILHYIFSYLSFHDLPHVRLVSKNWYLNTPSHFNFHFNASLFRKEDPTSYSHNDFCDSIRSSINASKNKLINADKRVLHAQFINGEYIRDIMKLLEQNNFHEVYLKMLHDYLPYIFQSKCLTILHLTKSVLNKRVLCDEVTIPSLQELKLECVTSSEDILSKFISKCPNIRQLSLVTCWAISFVVLTNLACLENLYVNVSDSSSFTNIQVIAPRLQVFHFILRNLEIEDIVVTMDIRACKMLREFHLNCSKFPNGLDPENFCSDFPHLETLLLGPCHTKKPIKTSGSSLRKWILSIPQVYECTRKCVVSSPNLSYFKYKGTTFQPYLAPSKLLETNYNIVLIPKINEIMKRAWFLKLRSHLENFSNHNTTLEIRIKTSACHPSSKPSGRAPTQPLHYIKHIMVDMNKLKYQEEHLMRYILLITYFGLIKKLYGRRNRNCCSGTHDKCWRHFLKYFEVKEEEEKEHPNAPSSFYAHPRKVKEDEKMDKLTKLIFIFFWKFNS
ncbi:hypothetical protein R3W88_010189 [Solanum pinnatisectum]|uniref:F-box domain-containing protein n=1 Tax=Solanum pinnatisectum TaxID=50273 RepID=A0AAV9ME90_9SOLN|nr:hypothetical protein R3W88_010189 [Solanum pinnatisectum]